MNKTEIMESLTISSSGRFPQYDELIRTSSDEEEIDNQELDFFRKFEEGQKLWYKCNQCFLNAYGSF